MPKAFDKLRSKIWGQLRNKKNPRTGKLFTSNDAYAVAVAQWKKTHNGALPSSEGVKDWQVMEFFVPISEAVSSGKDFMIRGIAINETTTRNGITYTASELELAAPTFRNKPMMIDHSNSIKDIVGRTTENVVYSSNKRAIEFEGRIMDEKIKEMINDGRITDVSIGAKVQDLVKNKDDESIVAVGIEGLEISLVAVPGDPGANLASALNQSFQLKESANAAESILNDLADELDLSEEVLKESVSHTELNYTKEDNMKEAEINQNEQSNEAVKTEEVKTEEVKTEMVKVDMSEVNASISALAEQVSKLTKKVAEQDNVPAPVEQSTEDEISKAPAEDETTGEVGEDESSNEEVAEESFVVEKADVGRGFQIYRDYSKDSGKFNRLCR